MPLFLSPFCSFSCSDEVQIFPHLTSSLKVQHPAEQICNENKWDYMPTSPDSGPVPAGTANDLNSTINR